LSLPAPPSAGSAGGGPAGLRDGRWASVRRPLSRLQACAARPRPSRRQAGTRNAGPVGQPRALKRDRRRRWNGRR
ncbi:hypothetical protein MC885_005040, partial [Smutsia gigantea]